MAKTKLKDLAPKSPAGVRGGAAGQEGTRPTTVGGEGGKNDNITLVRGAKPAKKRDLPPRKDVKGGWKKP